MTAVILAHNPFFAHNTLVRLRADPAKSCQTSLVTYLAAARRSSQRQLLDIKDGPTWRGWVGEPKKRLR
jgi:hypothetical protein